MDGVFAKSLVSLSHQSSVLEKSCAKTASQQDQKQNRQSKIGAAMLGQRQTDICVKKSMEKESFFIGQ